MGTTASWLIVCGAGAAGAVAGVASWAWSCHLLGEPLEGRRVLVALGCLSWALVVACLGPGAEALELCLLSCALLALSLTDVAALVIPNECVLAAAGVRLAYLARAGLLGLDGAGTLALRSLAGAFVAAITMLALTLMMDRVLGRESMGGGDLKLLVVAGLYVGWTLLAPLLFVACLGGLATSVLQACGRGSSLQPFPFGPAIAASLLLMTLVGPAVEAAMLIV